MHLGFADSLNLIFASHYASDLFLLVVLTASFLFVVSCLVYFALSDRRFWKLQSRYSECKAVMLQMRMKVVDDQDPVDSGNED